MRQEGYTADGAVAKQSLWFEGYLRVSEDMRQITAVLAEGNPRAKLALDIFVHRLRSSIGAMLASLGIRCSGVYAGIGENYATIRAAACEAFEFLGLRLDKKMPACLLLKTSAWRIQR